MNDLPDDPMTLMMQSASQLHEMYMSLMEAGFDEGQALKLVIAFITAAAANNNG